MEATQALVTAILTHPDLEKAEPCYVSVYRDERQYGGPEEGGWWYNVYTLEGGVPFITREAAEKFMEEKQAEVTVTNKEEEPDRWEAMANLPDDEPAGYPEGFIPTGWGDGGKLWVTIETALGSHDNSQEPRPYYC